MNKSSYLLFRITKSELINNYNGTLVTYFKQRDIFNIQNGLFNLKVKVKWIMPIFNKIFEFKQKRLLIVRDNEEQRKKITTSDYIFISIVYRF